MGQLCQLVGVHTFNAKPDFNTRALYKLMGQNCSSLSPTTSAPRGADGWLRRCEATRRYQHQHMKENNGGPHSPPMTINSGSTGRDKTGGDHTQRVHAHP